MVTNYVKISQRTDNSHTILTAPLSLSFPTEPKVLFFYQLLKADPNTFVFRTLRSEKNVNLGLN